MKASLCLASFALTSFGVASIAIASEEHANHSMHARPAQTMEGERTVGEHSHVPPDPPRNPLPDMPRERMIDLMEMSDDAPYGLILLDQLEWREHDENNALAWELQAFYGTDYDKVWLETEGEHVSGEEEGRAELLWDRIISSWWSVQAGVRYDFGEGPARTWASVGMQGLAPYFFEIDAALYLAEQGRTAARFSAGHDLLITQRLILRPELELNLYGKDDPANGIGSGLSDVELGLRLRYEIRRELAPYIGMHWSRKFGKTADLARAVGEDDSDLVIVAGLRAWF